MAIIPVSKLNQLDTFEKNIKTEFKMECATCNKTFEKQYDVGRINDYKVVAQEFAKKAYNDGWRESHSSVFNHTAIHCPECHEHRNDKKHFQF